MDLLEDRKVTSDSPIFKANMERLLKEHARKMDATQNEGYSVFKDPAFKGRSFSTDGDSLTYTQSALYRFVDMKKLRYPGGYANNGPKYKREKVKKFHNRIIMGHYNGLMKDLTYGAAEEVKQDLLEKFDNKNI